MPSRSSAYSRGGCPNDLIFSNFISCVSLERNHESCMMDLDKIPTGIPTFCLKLQKLQLRTQTELNAKIFVDFRTRKVFLVSGIAVNLCYRHIILSAN